MNSVCVYMGYGISRICVHTSYRSTEEYPTEHPAKRNRGAGGAETGETRATSGVAARSPETRPSTSSSECDVRDDDAHGAPRSRPQ
jgi:hypothetical protein